MKKLVLALTAVAAFTGSAIAADLPARTYSKAPAPVAYAPSWTGCYLGGGGGYGLWNQENTHFDDTNVLLASFCRETHLSAEISGFLGIFRKILLEITMCIVSHVQHEAC